MPTIPARDFWSDYMPGRAAEAVCRYVAGRGGAALGGFIGGAAGSYFFGAGGGAGAGAGSFIGGAAGGALGAAFCPTSSPEDGDYPLYNPPPFLGGQCLVEYSLQFTNDRYINDDLIEQGEIVIAPFALAGPIRSVTLAPGASRVNVQYGDNLTIDLPTGRPPNGTNRKNLRDIIATRRDGQADNCGNPGGNGGPSVPPPGAVPPIATDPLANNNIDIDLDFGSGGIVNLNGNLVLTGPTMGPGGLGLGFNFDGLDFNFFPNGKIEIGGGNPNPQNPGDQKPEDDKGQEFDGVFYSVTNTADNQSSDLVKGGLFFYPRFGSVCFTKGQERSEQFAMNGLSGFIKNPLPQYFTGISFTPYRATNNAIFDKRYRDICCFDEAPEK
jgi:hypothetical protein